MAFTLLEIFSMRFWSWRGSTWGRMSSLLSATWRGGRLGQPTHQLPEHSNAALKTAATPVENSRSSLGQHLPNRDGIATDLVPQHGLGHRKWPEPFVQAAKGWQKSHKDSLAAAAAKFWVEALHVCMRTESHCSLGVNHCHPDHDPPQLPFSSATPPEPSP